MAFQRVPETAEVRIIYNSIGVEISNLFYARQVGGYNQAGLDALAIAIDANVTPAFLALMATSDQYIRTDIRGLDSEYDLTASNNANAGYGLVSAYSLPPNFSFVVAQRSGLTGPASRGRTFVGPLQRNCRDLSAGNTDLVTVAYAAAYTGAVDSARTAIDNVGTFDPVLVSRYHNGGKRSEAITTPWATSVYLSLKIRTRNDRGRDV